MVSLLNSLLASIFEASGASLLEAPSNAESFYSASIFEASGASLLEAPSKAESFSSTPSWEVFFSAASSVADAATAAYDF